MFFFGGSGGGFSYVFLFQLSFSGVSAYVPYKGLHNILRPLIIPPLNDEYGGGPGSPSRGFVGGPGGCFSILVAVVACLKLCYH